MKDHLRSLLYRTRTPGESRLIVREYLQARILEALQRAGVFQRWAFLGGTALRFLYQLPRFSEDLDFSTLASIGSGDAARDEFTRFIDNIQRVFKAEAYLVDMRVRLEQTVQSAFIGFSGLLYELGLSSQRDQKLSIKIEVDTNPPPHSATETSLVRKHVFLNLLHYDKASLFAGKLHALLSRSHDKGRDVYDLMWYLTDSTWPEPNLELLRASLHQTGMELDERTVKDWRIMVSDHLSEMDWSRVVADVSPFLERSEEIEFLTRNNLLSLLNEQKREEL